MSFVLGALVGALLCWAVMKKLFHVGWVSSDWFETQLRQVEARLSQAENRIFRLESWRRA